MTTQKAAESRRKRHAQVSRMAQARTISRPLPDGTSFDLAYMHTGPADALPVLVFPGGPGVASALPYQGVRARAAKRGLRLVMMEHRGIGLSRTDTEGNDLPKSAITVMDVIDDAAAVLDAEGIDRAIIYGTSYGSYLAQSFGIRHPDRVAGMVLDSTMLGAHFGRSSTGVLRELFWEGTPQTHQQAETIRTLADSGVINVDDAGFPLQALYEFGGLPFIDRALALLSRGKGRRFWRWLQNLGADEIMTQKPFLMEFDLVGEIAFRELDYAAAGDHGPLETTGSFADAATQFSPFQGEPFDLPAQIEAFTWPTVVINGDRDIRTTREAAAQTASLIPDAVLLTVPDHGHSAFDTNPNLALDVMTALADRVRSSRPLTRADLPPEPTGVRSALHWLISFRLRLAGILPKPLS